MRICDVCGARANDLEEIKPEYKIDGAEELCSKCRVIINGQMKKLDVILRGLKVSWTQRCVSALRDKFLKK